MREIKSDTKELLKWLRKNQWQPTEYGWHTIDRSLNPNVYYSEEEVLEKFYQHPHLLTPTK